jgi:DNA-binding HxlR family transcriptional regulator
MRGRLCRNSLYYDYRSNSMSEAETDPQSEPPERVNESKFFSLFGRAHTLAVLNEFVSRDKQSIRFNELQDSLALSPNTLSRRLDELVKVGFLERVQYDEIPPRVEYESTEMVSDLEPVFRELMIWLERHGSDQLECS